MWEYIRLMAGQYPLEAGFIGSILGGVVVGATTWIVTKLIVIMRHKIRLFKLRSIFGPDFIPDKKYYIAFGALKLRPDAKRALKKIDKPDFPFQSRGAQTVFRVSRLVGSSELRAAQYISSFFGAQTGPQPVFKLDQEIKGDLDISWISLGGHSGNLKSKDTQEDDANDLIVMHRTGSFVSVQGREGKHCKIISEKDTSSFDFALLLRIRPNQFKHRIWIACQGLGEWGTSGSVYFLCNHWRELLKYSGAWWNLWSWGKGKNFAVIIKVRPHQDESAEIVNLGECELAFNDSDKLMEYCIESNHEWIKWEQIEDAGVGENVLLNTEGGVGLDSTSDSMVTSGGKAPQSLNSQ